MQSHVKGRDDYNHDLHTRCGKDKDDTNDLDENDRRAVQARAKMILSEGEEEASRRLVDAGKALKK